MRRVPMIVLRGAIDTLDVTGHVSVSGEVDIGEIDDTVDVSGTVDIGTVESTVNVKNRNYSRESNREQVGQCTLHHEDTPSDLGNPVLCCPGLRRLHRGKVVRVTGAGRTGRVKAIRTGFSASNCRLLIAGSHCRANSGPAIQ